jgi:transcriptional regulator with XRE-family HTH domain
VQVTSRDVESTIGRRLRARRRNLGVTMAELADRVGVSFQQIQKYECGATSVSAGRLYELSRALDVEVAYFFPHVEHAERSFGPA